MPTGSDSRKTVAPLDAPHRRYRPTTTGAAAARWPHWRTLHAGEPENCRRDLRQLVPILIHMALLLAVVHVFRVEGRAFRIVLGLTAALLPLHYALPYAWKQPALIAGSLVGLAWVFGIGPAAAVMAIGALLIGVCYLPLSWKIRATLVGAIALALALVRGSILPGVDRLPGFGSVVIPLVATFFMFRMIIYLYELKHAKRPERLLDTLSYFALLPNLCFLHFPVVDYKTMLRSYFSSDVHSTMRRGLDMIGRGVTHLLMYRLIYQVGLIGADEVVGPASLGRYLVSTYLLYLKVSGQFHVACGMLHLFGYQLPETHHHYFLATGFTDYWRRINIYWKDFMVRVVFHPIAFRLKKRPQAVSLTVATVAVFVTTWALHAYQSFWLRGHWGFSVTDALFWGVLGALVLINVHQDARRPRRKNTQKNRLAAWSLRGVKTLGTFVVLTLLWSLWSSPSLTAWLQMLQRGLTGI